MGRCAGASARGGVGNCDGYESGGVSVAGCDSFGEASVYGAYGVGESRCSGCVWSDGCGVGCGSVCGDCDVGAACGGAGANCYSAECSSDYVE